VPLIENSSTDFIWLYYNNSAASSAEDAAGTYDEHYVGVWHLNGTSPDLVKDFTQYGNNGTFNGSSLEFDGVDDWVQVVNDNSLDTLGDFAIEMWVYNKAGTVWWPTLLNRDNQVSSDGYFWIYTTGTDEANLNFQWANGSSVRIEGFSSALGKDVWNHVVFTFTNNTKELKLYIDGTQKGTTRTLTDYLPVDNGTLYIGTYGGRIGNYPFNGTIDEIRIYNRSLSAGEVLEHYRGNFSNNTGMVLYLPFKEGTGTNAEDLSGLGNFV
jgi:hypothetical protein